MNVTELKKLNVCVLAGGDSAEREVSLSSSKAVQKGLEHLGHQVTFLDSSTVSLEEISQQENILESDIVFIVLHGGAGENGEVQSALESAGRRFTGSNSIASALAMDKPMSKTLARKLGIVTPNWIEFPVSQSPKTLANDISTNVGLPAILKPADGGSTVGLTLIKDLAQIPDALSLLQKHCQIGMAEEYIHGRELTVAALDGEPYEVVEVKPRNEIYDYQAKYTKGGSEYFCPADIESSLRTIIRKRAQLIYKEVGCTGLARVDYILDSNYTPQFLELNTIPGMTDLSLAPMSAAGSGIEFTELLQKTLQSALA